MVVQSSVQMRRRLVDHLRRRGFMHDPRVAEAFLAVPREVFIPDTLRGEGLVGVYRDDAIVTHRDPTTNAPLSSSSQPAIMAIMLELLDVQPGHRVVEIGAGTGYNAALLDLLAGSEGLVVTIDIDDDIASAAAHALRDVGARAHVVVADGAVGLPAFGGGATPADRMEVTASSSVIPRCWHQQLALDGRLVVPLRLSDRLDRAHAVTAFRRVPRGFDSVAVTPGGFMPLRTPAGSPFDPTGRLGSGLLPEAPTTPPSPFAEVAREEMDRLEIFVRYSPGPPPTRWTFPRGDHWIGIDVA